MCRLVNVGWKLTIMARYCLRIKSAAWARLESKRLMSCFLVVGTRALSAEYPKPLGVNDVVPEEYMQGPAPTRMPPIS